MIEGKEISSPYFCQSVGGVTPCALARPPCCTSPVHRPLTKEVAFCLLTHRLLPSPPPMKTQLILQGHTSGVIITCAFCNDPSVGDFYLYH